MFCSGLTHLVLAEEDLEVLVAVALDSCEVFKLFLRFVLCSSVKGYFRVCRYLPALAIVHSCTVIELFVAVKTL